MSVQDPSLAQNTYPMPWWAEHLVRLRLLIALAVAFGLAVPSLILAQREGAAVQKENFAQLNTDLQQLTTVSAEGLRDSLWQVSPELGQTVAQAIFRDPRIRLLRVRDLRSQTPFLEYQRPVTPGEATLSLQREVRYLDSAIGNVELVLSPASAS